MTTHSSGSGVRRSLSNRTSCCSASAKDGQLERVILCFSYSAFCTPISMLWRSKPLAALSWPYVYKQDSVEMYVASGYDRDAESSTNRLRRAPPRSQSSAGTREQPGSGEGLQRLVPTDHTKALRAELRVTGAELRSKSAELSEAKQMIR